MFKATASSKATPSSTRKRKTSAPSVASAPTFDIARVELFKSLNQWVFARVLHPCTVPTRPAASTGTSHQQQGYFHGIAIAEDGDKARKQMGLPAAKAPSSALAADAPAAPPLPAAPAAPASAADPFARPAEAPEIDSGHLTTQAVNQLRPTGRRSLQIEVPLTGKTFHFRKLKDHAVLDLTLKHPWQEGKAEQATAFGIGLGIWGVLVLFCGRRRKRMAQAQ